MPPTFLVIYVTLLALHMAVDVTARCDIASVTAVHTCWQDGSSSSLASKPAARATGVVSKPNTQSYRS